jgi:hypothetical protein
MARARESNKHEGVLGTLTIVYPSSITIPVSITPFGKILCLLTGGALVFGLSCLLSLPPFYPFVSCKLLFKI